MECEEVEWEEEGQDMAEAREEEEVAHTGEDVKLDITELKTIYTRNPGSRVRPMEINCSM